ncbi:MAG: sensor histidine kinase, partial [Myxococcota bacterium]
TLAGGAIGLPLHDGLARLVPVPELPVAVVRVSEDPARARAYALAAGAREVWGAFPAGDPRLGNASPDPETLAAGSDGRIRFAGAVRLPLPEALPGLLEIDAAHIGPGTPATALAGRSVVLVHADPAIGRRESVPGSTAPVDRGRVLAVALGTVASGRGLHVVPLPLAAALAAAIAVGWHRQLGRWMPLRGAAATFGIAVAIVLLAVAARAARVDLPVGGLLAAVALACAARLALAGEAVLEALDDVLAGLGAAPADPRVDTGLAALADMLDLHAPGSHVVVWAGAPGARPEVVARRGEPGVVPDLVEIPAARVSGDGWVVEPIVERGEVVGAVGVGIPGGPSAEHRSLLADIASRGAAMVSPAALLATDPLAARLALTRASVRRALTRSARWEALLGSAGSTLGVFDVAGGLVTGSVAMRAAAKVAGEGADVVPLVAALRALTPLREADLWVRLRAALRSPQPTRLPGRSPDEEVCLTRIRATPASDGLLVQVHDVSAHRRRDDVKSGLLTATGYQARNALTVVGGYASMMADEADADGRASLRLRVVTQVERIARMLERAETLAASRPGDAPAEPVHVHECVANVATSLAVERRDRLSVDLPRVCAPVAARGETLARALGYLISDVTERARARLRVSAERDGVIVAVEDDDGGLPETMLEALVDPHNVSSAPAAARRLVEDMGGQFSAQSTAGLGVRYEVRLAYY